MLGYMARLGNFTFGIDTAAFQALDRTSQYRWSPVNRIGRKPAQQTSGPDADTIELSGVIYPHFSGGLGQMRGMRDMAGKGRSLPLVYSDSRAGQFAGNFCIKSISEKRTVFFPDGTPRKIEFSLSLVEYGDDAGSLSAAGTSLMQQKLSDVAAGKLAFPSITGNSILDGAFSAARTLSIGLGAATGSVIATLNSQLDTVSGFIADLGIDYPAVSGAIVEGIDAANTIKSAGAVAVTALGIAPNSSRISTTMDYLIDQVARPVQVATRSSASLIDAYSRIDTSTSPAALVQSMRSATRSVGQLAKLGTDTAISSLRIREDIA